MKKFFGMTFLIAVALCAYFYNKADAQIYLDYKAYVQDAGWLAPVHAGEIAGTTGQHRRMEAVIINLTDGKNGCVEYSAHVQNIGWQAKKKSGEVAGTLEQNLRMEAIAINLINGYEKKFDIYYRAHVENGGWLGWAKNGEPAGTAGASLRMEALQIKIVPKDSPFDRGGAAFYQKVTIVGENV